VAETAEAAGPAVFTFTQACDRAAKFDEQISRALADAAQLQIDLAQARSLVWPRADLRTFLQIPLGNGNYEGVKLFNGGVFFRYDFEKFLFSGDESAVARARIEEKLENIKLALQRLSQDLFRLFAEREALRTEVALRRGMQTHASEALETVHVLERTGRIKPERAFEYQYQYETCTRLYQETVRRLADTNRIIADRLSITGNQEIVITDFPEMLASMEGIVPAPEPDKPFFAELWSKRHDARLAEAELFLKEMAVIDARRKRIPDISASFGLGSVTVSSTFNQPPVVVQLGASMPLLDFGDIKREISKANIERDLAERNTALLFLQMHRDVKDASAALSEAIAARKAADDYRNLTARQDETNRKLVSLQLVDNIDLLTFRIRAGEAEIELKRAQIDVAKAAAEYARVSGLDLGGGMGDPVLGKTK
jgi:outer membrane protein TolC